jgi:hypothetical protein
VPGEIAAEALHVRLTKEFRKQVHGDDSGAESPQARGGDAMAGREIQDYPVPQKIFLLFQKPIDVKSDNLGPEPEHWIASAFRKSMHEGRIAGILP